MQNDRAGHFAFCASKHHNFCNFLFTEAPMVCYDIMKDYVIQRLVQ